MGKGARPPSKRLSREESYLAKQSSTYRYAPSNCDFQCPVKNKNRNSIHYCQSVNGRCLVIKVYQHEYAASFSLIIIGSNVHT